MSLIDYLFFKSKKDKKYIKIDKKIAKISKLKI